MFYSSTYENVNRSVNRSIAKQKQSQRQNKIQSIEFRNETLYKWEIGKNFITIYDDINFKKKGYVDILDFLATKCNVLIKKDKYVCIYQGQGKQRKRKYVKLQPKNNDLSAYRQDCQILISHLIESDYHTFSASKFFFGKRRPPHIHIVFNDESIKEKHVNLILEWMTEYLNEDLATLREKYHDVIDLFPKSIPMQNLIK